MSRPRDWYPLRRSDPVGGNAAAIQRLAQRYADTAEAINTAATALREIHGSSTAWNSDAGRAFRDRTVVVADTIHKAHDRYANTAEALATYAIALDDIQADADIVVARAQQAAADRWAAERGRSRNFAQPDLDPVAESRLVGEVEAATIQIGTADEQLEAIEARWRTAGNTAADAIEEISGGDELEDGFWDDVLDFVAVITEWAGKLSAIFGVIALICALVPVLAPFAALFGALALITGAVSLAGNVVLSANGRATLADVLWAMVGVFSFGAGRAFQLAGRAMTTGTRGLARPAFIQHLQATGHSRRAAQQSARDRGVAAGGSAASALASRARTPTGWLPTRAEWVEAYRPSRLFENAVTGPNPVIHPATRVAPQVAAGLDRAAAAGLSATAADAAGTAGNIRTMGLWARENQPATPVGSNR